MGAANTARREGQPTLQFECSLPEAVSQLQPGDSVWINDGKLGLVVERREAEGAVLRVTHAGPKGTHLRADKGLNFPDTDLRRR